MINSSFLKLTIFIFAILIFNGCINNVESNRLNKNAQTIQEIQPEYDVNSTFYDELRLSPDLGVINDKYKNKIFSIKGFITEINTIEEPIITVMTENAGVGVVCLFDIVDKEEIKKLSAGQNVIFYGTYSGVETMIQFEKCKIISFSPASN